MLIAERVLSVAALLVKADHLQTSDPAAADLIRALAEALRAVTQELTLAERRGFSRD